MQNVYKKSILITFILKIFMLTDKSLILNKIKKYYGLKSDASFARFLKIKPQTLSSWYSRNTFDIDLLYSKCGDIDANWLLTGKGLMLKTEDPVTGDVFRLKTDNNVQHQSVPLYDIQASASVVALFRDSSTETPVDHITIPNLPKCDGAIYVSGDSMYPLLKSGDIIMYKKVANEIDNMFWGEMYLVSLINNDGDEFVMVKWLHKSELGTDYVKLVSENRHHQPKDFHIKNIKGLALIKASVRINSMY